jgi:hypothetical protein
MTTLEILEAARAKIAESPGAMTACAALDLVSGNCSTANIKATHALEEAIPKHAFLDGVVWAVRYDAILRYRNQVLAWFDRAIQLAKERETP